MALKRNILEVAIDVVKERAARYGDRKRTFSKIAALWSVILDHPVTARDVALCMMAMKQVRFLEAGDLDSLVDIAGYAHVAEDFIDAKTEEPAEPPRGVSIAVGRITGTTGKFGRDASLVWCGRCRGNHPPGECPALTVAEIARRNNHGRNETTHETPNETEEGRDDHLAGREEGPERGGYGEPGPRLPEHRQ